MDKRKAVDVLADTKENEDGSVVRKSAIKTIKLAQAKGMKARIEQRIGVSYLHPIRG